MSKAPGNSSTLPSAALADVRIAKGASVITAFSTSVRIPGTPGFDGVLSAGSIVELRRMFHAVHPDSYFDVLLVVNTLIMREDRTVVTPAEIPDPEDDEL